LLHGTIALVDRVIDAPEARHLIRRSFPDVAAARLELMPHPGWGGDSDAWLVDGRWIFRFPRSADVARCLAVEVCLLPRISAALPAQIPRFDYVARDAKDRPSFVGYEAIPGQPLRAEALRALPARVVEHLAEQVGDFLRALHATPAEVAVRCGVDRPTGSPRQRTERWLRQVESTVFPALDGEERDWVERRFRDALAETSRFAFAPVVCHGDLSSDHLLIDPGGRGLAGVIDFGDVTIGDPAGEFTWREEYGEAFYRRALAAYGTSDPWFSSRVSFQIDCLPLIQIAYGVETGLTEDVVEGRRMLRSRIATT
jgi:aminoglycoside 2''-phosphotransferase